MVYRDGAFEPRLAELRAVLATEPSVREQLARICFEQDALVVEVDRVERELAEHEASSSWFGRSEREAAIAQLRGILADLIPKRDASIARERAVLTQLETIAAARQELRELDDRARHQLRTREGALGDELRALVAIAAAEDLAIARLKRLLVAGESVLLALRGIIALEVEVQGEPSLALAPFLAVRRQQFVDAAVEALGHLASTITATTDPELDAGWLVATSRSPHLVADAPEISEPIDTAMSTWLADRRRREAVRGEALARERALADQALPRR